jgi:hypothetical protein
MMKKQILGSAQDDTTKNGKARNGAGFFAGAPRSPVSG